MSIADRSASYAADAGGLGDRYSHLPLVIWEAAWKYDAGEDFRQEASIAKSYSSEALDRVVDRAFRFTVAMASANGCPWSAGIGRRVSVE